MHILVVDGFGETVESRDRFKNFLRAVNAAFDSVWPFDRCLQTRKYDDLREYLDMSGSSAEHLIRVEPIKVFTHSTMY